MERFSENKNPVGKVNKRSKKNCDAFTQTVIDNIPTQCVIRDNVKKNQNDIKHTKLGNDSDSISSTSNTDCSIAGTTTVPECDDIRNKKASKFIKKVLNNELDNEIPNNEQLSVIAMILSRRSAKLAELNLEDEVLMKSAEILHHKYNKQISDVQTFKSVQRSWKRKFQRLHLYIDSINIQLNALTRLPNPAVKCVRNVGTLCNLTEPYE
ncbi:hypothetical protein AGLY_004953 [Aphis glycines]|uniref:Uncharacterized protein n=1 Tax=Aphis glycines TaxID=307491 RepID=A0A6G0TVH5_APHGL|nr:hypothetical protein AGLY_004953 [Aphis glycines]